MKKLMSAVLIGCMMIALTSCGKMSGGTDNPSDTGSEQQISAASSASDASSASAGSDAIDIGITNMTLKEAVYKFMNDSAVATAAELGGINVNWLSSENDPTVQANQVDNFIVSGVDVLVIEPARSDAAKDMVQKAQAANIPVINLEALIRDAVPDLRIASDPYKVGVLQVEDYVKRTGGNPTGKAIILSGSKGDEAAETITKANEEYLKDKAPGLEVVVQQFHDAWDRQKAMNTMENALTQYGDEIKVVFANNDTMAIGAIQAAKNAGLDEQIMFYGADFDKDTAEMLVEGASNYAVVDRGALELGRQMVVQGQKMAAGQTPDITEVVDGVNTLWIPVTIVDKDNVREFGKAKYPELMQ